MKKLLSLLSIVTIIGTAVPTTIATSPYQKEEYKIENSDINLQSKNLIRIKRQVRKKYKPLRELITNFNLGELRDNYEDTILHAIERLNPAVNSNDIRIVKIPNNNTALIAWSHATNSVGINDDVIWVRFSISSEGIVGNSRFYNIPINIDGLEISNPTLQHSTNEITKQSLISVGEKAGTSGISQQQNKKIQRPKVAPPTPPTSNKGVQLKANEPIYATVLPKNQRITKDISVLVPAPINLANFLLNTNLGELTDNRPETILNAVISLNPNVIINEIEVGTILENSASIIPTSNSRYLGTVMVNFTLNNENQMIKNDVKKLIDKFNKMDNTKNLSPCNNSTTKIGATIGSTMAGAGAIVGSVIPGIGTLIGAGIGALVGGGTGIATIEAVCNKI